MSDDELSFNDALENLAESELLDQPPAADMGSGMEEESVISITDASEGARDHQALEIQCLRSLLENQSKLINALTQQVESLQAQKVVAVAEASTSSTGSSGGTAKADNATLEMGESTGVGNHFNSIRRLKLVSIDYDIEQLGNITNESGGLNLIIHSDWSLDNLPKLPLAPLGMGSTSTWCVENSQFDATTIPQRIVDNVRREMDHIVRTVLDIQVANYGTYAKVIRKLGLLIEKNAISESYLWRSRNALLAKVVFLDRRAKRNHKIGILQFHFKNRAREFTRSCLVHLEAVSSIQADPVTHQALIIRSLKQLLSRLWWFANLDLGVSRTEKLSSPTAF